MSDVRSDTDKKEMLKALELNMNEEIRATLQYICHRISARDREQVLSESFKTAALDEMAHILYFSDLIQKFGGKPKFTEWHVDKSDDIREMLEADIDLERSARERYGHQLTRLSGYPEVIAVVESVLGDEGDHEEKFGKYLDELGSKGRNPGT